MSLQELEDTIAKLRLKSSPSSASGFWTSMRHSLTNALILTPLMADWIHLRTRRIGNMPRENRSHYDLFGNAVRPWYKFW